MPFSIHLETLRLPPGLQPGRAAVITEHIVRPTVDYLSTDLCNRLRLATPVGVTGLTRKSWQRSPARRIGTTVEAIVGNTQLAALILDAGARPHTPPLAPIQLWARRKLLAAKPRRVAKAIIWGGIRKRGLPARRIFTNIWKDFQKIIKERCELLTNMIAEALEKE